MKGPIQVFVELVQSLMKGTGLFRDSGPENDACIIDFQVGLGRGQHAPI